MILSVLEAIMISSTLSMDAFVASFAYGGNGIKIPVSSVSVISLVCGSMLGISLLAGAVIRSFTPDWLTAAICFIILFTLGMSKLLDSITKSIIRKHSHVNKKIKFSMFNFNFILNLYADPVEADVDESKTISPAEAFSLAAALSLDGIAVGFGAALGNVNIPAVFLCSLVTDALAVILGACAGNKVAKKIPFNISWFSGAVLIVLAILKLV